MVSPGCHCCAEPPGGPPCVATLLSRCLPIRAAPGLVRITWGRQRGKLRQSGVCGVRVAGALSSTHRDAVEFRHVGVERRRDLLGEHKELRLRAELEMRARAQRVELLLLRAEPPRRRHALERQLELCCGEEALVVVDARRELERPGDVLRVVRPEGRPS